MQRSQQSEQDTLEIAALGTAIKALVRASFRPPGLPIDITIDSGWNPEILHSLVNGTYETEQLRLIQRHLRAGQRVLDVGACIGVTSTVSAAMTGKRVIAIEPNLDLHESIRAQARLNGVSVLIEGSCVGPRNNPRVPFYVHRQPTRSALKRHANPEQDYRAVNCRMKTLFELTNRYRPDAVLIDVEGAEYDIFRRRFSNKPSLLIVKINNLVIGETASTKVLQEIADQGYRLIDRAGWSWVFQLNGGGPECASHS